MLQNSPKYDLKQQSFFMHKLGFLLVLSLITLSSSRTCLGISGHQVSWWVQLIFPGKFGNHFAYMDSTYMSDSFTVFRQQADSQLTALTQTLNQINNHNLQSVAWNDQWPTGQASSSKAHSKGVLGFDDGYTKGFYLGHSIPKYPAFDGFKVNPIINESQSIYGQHSFCFSLDSLMLKDMLNRILPIRPYIYANNLKNKQLFTQVISQFGQFVEPPDYTSLFTIKDYTVGEHKMRTIFKNGGLNGSIFEEGLNTLLKSQVLAETWGRPLQQPWCGHQFIVTNIKKITFNSQIQWLTTQDHSKWAYTRNGHYACFGDMNRMTSQWKRGGAFYCIQSQNLNKALKKITTETHSCQFIQKQKQDHKISYIVSAVIAIILGLLAIKLKY